MAFVSGPLALASAVRAALTVFFGVTLKFKQDYKLIIVITRGQSNLIKCASRGAHSPVRGHPRGSKFVPLNSGVGVPISVP